MSIELDRIAEIRESLDRVQQVAEAVDAEGTLAEATDDTGSVSVQLGHDGAIVSLVVDADWPDHYRPEELGQVVRDTIRAAEVARLRTALTMTGERLRDAPPTTRPMPPTSDSLPGRLREILAERPAGAVDAQAVASRLNGVVDEALHALGESRELLEARRRARYDGHREGGVVATADAQGQLLEVAYDGDWLRGQSALAISLATTDAIVAARAEASAAAARSSHDATPLERLARELQDPMAVADRLGLLG
ncbi:hypothetical protein Bcav_0409 [Beutenbergia cavernae DSM 12333]|uniref:YbaB/EbfC DNA-binding family protein n=1 Tax=Beutenbergia cavernae (strain ATCC BAA-8 / DSM 12333 / CCUG 43141 / JCM 11478 / NBRC 16432 / NCIMB 13614 / HKI 0122) TaxID=471853 RepID=C5BWZ8_BEUC1|nr:hypothetical protein [Beutenbergia cavernae]ACQ78673.1 hypothetical protein Bcav_0409 [Beutenbergia cavernae DSM 12333]